MVLVPLRQRALAEDDESFAIAGDRGRDLSSALVDEYAPASVAFGAAQDHLAVRVIYVPYRRLLALLTRVRVQISEFLARRLDLEDGGEVDIGRRAALAPAVRATLRHRGGSADHGRRSIELAGSASRRPRKAHDEYSKDDTAKDKSPHDLAPFQRMASALRV